MMDFTAREHTCIDETGAPLTFHYHLLCDTAEYGDRLIPDYGIAVSSSQGEHIQIPHISPDFHRVSDLLTLLCEQAVSPIHLRDVVDDWL